MNHNGSNGWFGFKGSILLVVGLLGFAAVFYGSGVGTGTSTKPAAAPAGSHAHKPVRAMNVALGPMVFLARELDFTVKSAGGERLDNNQIATRVENQLLGLRNLYRGEIAKNAKLAGSITLHFSVNPNGEVSLVKEVSGRINDLQFKNSVVAETAKWTFADMIAEPVTIQCPLLFVQEGMDITTLVHWEGLLSGAAEKKVTDAVSANTGSTQPAKAAAPTAPPTVVAKAAPATVKVVPAAVKIDAEEVRIKYTTLLRKEPNFSAPVLTTFTIGTTVTVINRTREWLEVRSHHSGPSGYIRKEFVTPVDVAVNR